MNAVDTNILVYAVDETEPAKQSRATKVLRRLSQLDEPLVIPWQVAAEFLACLRRWENAGRISRDDTQAYLTQFLQVAPIVFPTSESLRGRIKPADTLPYVFGRLKRKDGLCIGIFPRKNPDEIHQNIALTRQCTGRRAG